MQIRSRYVKVGMLVFNPQYGIGVDMSIALLETKFKTLKTRFSPGEGAEKKSIPGRGDFFTSTSVLIIMYLLG